jgi:hypothetical protein
MEILFAPSSLEAATTARSMPPHLRKRQPTSSVDTTRTTQAYKHPPVAEPDLHDLTSRIGTVWNTPADEHLTGVEPELNGSKQTNGFLGYSVEVETRTLQRSEVSLVNT